MEKYLLSLVLLISVAACSNNQENNSVQGRPDFESIPVYNAQESISVSEFDDGQFFASVVSAFEGEDGTVFAFDARALKIYMFDRDGRYLGFLGGEGEGPGEFKQPGSISLLAPDTFSIMDWSLARITLFSNKSGTWEAVEYFDRPSGSREFGSEIYFNFNNLYTRPNGYFARFQSSFTPVDTATHSFAYYILMDEELNPVDETEYGMHHVSKVYLVRNQGQSLSVTSVPQAHRRIYDFTSDGREVSSWTGENLISIRNIVNGDSTAFEFPSKRIPITEDEKNEIAEERIPNPGNSPFTRAGLKERIPDYKPLARQLLVDDKNRIWVLVHPFQEGDREWLIYSTEGELLGAANHPGGRATQIYGNRMYVIFSSGDVEPSFAAYKLVQSDT